jgi:hypothetical protein
MRASSREFIASRVAAGTVAAGTDMQGPDSKNRQYKSTDSAFGHRAHDGSEQGIFRVERDFNGDRGFTTPAARPLMSWTNGAKTTCGVALWTTGPPARAETADQTNDRYAASIPVQNRKHRNITDLIPSRLPSTPELLPRRFQRRTQTDSSTC